MRKLWKSFYYVLSVIFLSFSVWMFASWVDIIADNLERNPEHYPWNFFVVMEVLDNE